MGEYGYLGRSIVVCLQKSKSHIDIHLGLVWYQMKIYLERDRLNGPFDSKMITTNNMVSHHRIAYQH